MAESRLSRRMSAQDASFLYFETPDAPLHIGSVALYEGTIPFEEAFAALDARMHTIPRYRQRAIIPPFYAGHPTWEDDPEFSLSRHYRAVSIDPPGSIEQLRELSAEIFRHMLPRDRPLWDMVMVHGIEGGTRTAIVSRVHHALVDGVSGIELLMAVLDLTPEVRVVDPPAEEWRPKPPPNPLDAWFDAMFDQWEQGLRAINDFEQNLFDPRTQLRNMTAFARAMEIALPAALRPRQPAPWNKRIGKERRTAWAEMNFQEIRGIRSRLGGTVNDVVLTVLGGGIGRYLRERGVRVEGQSVRVMIPVNVRSEHEQGALGNRVSMMLPDVPIGIPNPAERLEAIRTEMETRKAQNQSGAFEALQRLSENVPAAFHALAGRGGVPSGIFNLVCTNVPGPLIPLYCVGHRMLAHYPLVPLAGDLGLGVGVTSYDKALYMGVMADPQCIEDVDRIARYVEDDFRTLRELAGVEVSDLPDFSARRNGSETAAAVATAAVDAPAEVGTPAR